MPKLKREFFDGKSKFVPNKYSNYYDGKHHADEWRIERRFGTQGTISQRFCDFFGTRAEALIVCKALELVPMLMKKLAKMKIELKTALDNYRETFSQLAQAEEATSVTRKLLTQAQEETQEKATIIQALMIELRSQRVELTREHESKVATLVQDVDKKAGTIKYLEEQLGIARRDAGNYAFAAKRQLKKRTEAEALVGRIIIKRDRRRKNVRLISITNTTEETRSLIDAIRKEVERG